MEQRARDFFGLDASGPPALPMRIEGWWRDDGFAAMVPHTGSIMIPLGRDADRTALAQSVAAIVHRHEALRCRLKIENGHALLVADDTPPQLELVSASRAEIKTYREGKSPVAEFLKAPINLYEQTGFRFRAFRDEDGDVTLAVLMHHYFGDAWSSQILRREIEALYAAAVKDEVLELPPVAQYSDYALAQRKSLAGKLPAHIAYWRARLGEPQPLAFPFDRSGSDPTRLERAIFLVGGDVLERLNAMVRELRISMAMIAYAAFQIALGRWCGQSEVVTAVNSIDRVKLQFRDTVGSLMTSIPVSSQIEPGTSVRDFLRATAKDFYDAISHQELAFEQYEKIFQPAGPFCSARFNFVPRQKHFNLGDETGVPAIAGIEKAPGMRKIAAFRDFHLFVVEYADGLGGRVTFNPDFSFEKISAFIEIYKTVLAGMAANPDGKLGGIS